MDELSGCDRKYIAHKAKIFTIWPLKKTFASPWSVSACGCSTSGLPSSSYTIEKNHLGSVFLPGSPILCVPEAWHRPLNSLYCQWCQGLFWGLLCGSCDSARFSELRPCWDLFRQFSIGLSFSKDCIFWLWILCRLHVLQVSFPSLLLIFFNL